MKMKVWFKIGAAVLLVSFKSVIFPYCDVLFSSIRNRLCHVCLSFYSVYWLNSSFLLIFLHMIVWAFKRDASLV